MEMKDISSYEKFILLAEKTNSLSSTMRSYVEFKEVLKIVRECAKSDNEHIIYEGNITPKPITMHEAKKALNNLEKIKWDSNFLVVSTRLNIPLK